MNNDLFDTKENIYCLDNNYRYRLRVLTNNWVNNVILFLHGGCGTPDRHIIMKYQRTLAKDFTLVCWDQRGSGLAYSKSEAAQVSLTLDLYVEDVKYLVKELKKRFNKDKIIIVGHSFGTALAVSYIQKYPDDVLAYVGVGQISDSVRNEKQLYDFVLSQAKRYNMATAVKKLENIGEPVDGTYKNGGIFTVRNYLHKFGGAMYKSKKSMVSEFLADLPLMHKEYNLFGIIKYLKGLKYVVSSPLAQESYNFIDNVKQLNVPVYLMLGRQDINCSTDLAREWFEALVAPKKQLIIFDISAHFPHREESFLWNRTLKKLLESDI